jgi:hypothetical protein
MLPVPTQLFWQLSSFRPAPQVALESWLSPGSHEGDAVQAVS